MDSELLLKFIGYFPDYLSALSRTLLRFFWTTVFETAVYPTSFPGSLLHFPGSERGETLEMMLQYIRACDPACRTVTQTGLTREGFPSRVSRAPRSPPCANLKKRKKLTPVLQAAGTLSNVKKNVFGMITGYNCVNFLTWRGGG